MTKAIPARAVLATAAALTVSLALCSSALAAPVTVHVRVEGTNATLFDGSVTTDARSISAPDPPPKGQSPGPANPHPCDVKDNGSNGGFGSSYGTPTTALYDAVSAQGINAYWYSSFSDFFINGIGADVTYNFAYAVNFTTAGVGGCQFQLAPNSDVLWAANGGTAAHLLKLEGPSDANVGSSTVFRVTDGQNGQPVSGATVANTTSDANGNAAVTFSARGTQTLKASRGDSVRSAALGVCVHNGNDGTCGTTAPSPLLPGGLPAPTVKPRPAGTLISRIVGLRNHQRFRRRNAPRSLRVQVSVPSGGVLRQVRIRLERRVRGGCLYLDGRSERFRRQRCGHGAFFAVGNTTSLSYLLPRPLARGNYVFDVQAVDARGRATGLLPGVSHVVFDVR